MWYDPAAEVAIRGGSATRGPWRPSGRRCGAGESLGAAMGLLLGGETLALREIVGMCLATSGIVLLTID